MIAIIDFMIFGGAVMMSALVESSAQMPISPRWAGGGGVLAGRGLGAGAGVLALQLGGQICRVGITQIANLRIAAFLERGIQVRDQRPVAQPVVLGAGDQHAVGAFVGDHGDARTAAAFTLLCTLVERANQLDDLGCRGVLQADDFVVLIGGLIDARNDAAPCDPRWRRGR